MDKNKKKELIESYKQMKVYMGVYQVKNTVDGKIYIGSINNLKSRWLTLKWQLEQGRFANKELQAAFKAHGENAFEYSVLEEVEIKEDTDVKWELEAMEKAWLDRLMPYEEKGYNKPAKL